jgi:hypothetical protein
MLLGQDLCCARAWWSFVLDAKPWRLVQMHLTGVKNTYATPLQGQATVLVVSVFNARAALRAAPSCFVVIATDHSSKNLLMHAEAARQADAIVTSSPSIAHEGLLLNADVCGSSSQRCTRASHWHMRHLRCLYFI